MLLRVVKSGSSCGELRTIGCHGTAATLEVASDHLIEILILNGFVIDPSGLKGIVEVLLGRGA